MQQGKLYVRLLLGIHST